LLLIDPFAIANCPWQTLEMSTATKQYDSQASHRDNQIQIMLLRCHQHPCCNRAGGKQHEVKNMQQGEARANKGDKDLVQRCRCQDPPPICTYDRKESDRHQMLPHQQATSVRADLSSIPNKNVTCTIWHATGLILGRPKINVI